MLADVERKMDSFKGLRPSGVSVGRALPYFQVRIVDEEDRDVPPWEPGEVLCYGENVMKGYWRQPEATEETLRNGWLHTGDIGLFADDGDIYIVDRKKDMILSGDENIYPAEVEEVLYQRPEVEECAVVGIPDPEWGERVTAFIVLRAGEILDLEALKSFLKSRLSSFKVPKEYISVGELPKSPAGKLLKRELQGNFSKKP
jgi:acyl-CoA synthetase (AMP-forming)/AMP-acid ligase II